MFIVKFNKINFIFIFTYKMCYCDGTLINKSPNAAIVFLNPFPNNVLA